MSIKNRKGDIILIIDESGSMQDMGVEAAQSATRFIKEQKVINVKDARVTLWKFNDKVIKIIDECPLDDNDEFLFDYKPEGATAMYDAIGQAITDKLKSDRKENNICLILTDGLDNTSRKFNMENAKNLIKK